MPVERRLPSLGRLFDLLLCARLAAGYQPLLQSPCPLPPHRLQAWCPGALMAVHRSRVRQRPRSFYATLLAQLAVGPDPEAGHYLERSWASMFYLSAALPRCQA